MNIYQDSNNTISTILYAATEEHAVPNVLYKDKEQTKPVSRKELHDLGHRGQILVSLTEYNLTYGYKWFETYEIVTFAMKYAFMSGMSDLFPTHSASEIVATQFATFKGADHTIDIFAVGNDDSIMEAGWQDILTVREDKIYGTVNCYFPRSENEKIALMYAYMFPNACFNSVEQKVYGLDGKELYIDGDSLCVYLGVPSRSNPNKMEYMKLSDNEILGNWWIEIPFYDSVPKKNRKFEIKLKLADGTFQTTTYDCSNVNFTFTKEWEP